MYSITWVQDSIRQWRRVALICRPMPDTCPCGPRAELLLHSAAQFKFTKMTRKAPFKPLVHGEGVFTDTPKIIEVHGKAMDFRDREALIFPDRIKEKGIKWTLNPTEGAFLQKMPGRERQPSSHWILPALCTISGFIKAIG